MITTELLPKRNAELTVMVLDVRLRSQAEFIKVMERNSTMWVSIAQVG